MYKSNRYNKTTEMLELIETLKKQLFGTRRKEENLDEVSAVLKGKTDKKLELYNKLKELSLYELRIGFQCETADDVIKVRSLDEIEYRLNLYDRLKNIDSQHRVLLFGNKNKFIDLETPAIDIMHICDVDDIEKALNNFDKFNEDFKTGRVIYEGDTKAVVVSTIANQIVCIDENAVMKVFFADLSTNEFINCKKITVTNKCVEFEPIKDFIRCA